MTRKVCLIVHRYVGLAIALFLVVAGATGMAISFYDEIDTGLNKEIYHIPADGREPLSISAITKSLNTHLLKDRAIIRATLFPDDEKQSYRFIVLPKESPETGKPYSLDFDWVFVDPYSGQILATRKFGAWKFDRIHVMPLLWELHYSLTLPWPYGEWLFGLAALLWLFDCFVASYLTFPKKRSGFLKIWKKSWKIHIRSSTASAIRSIHVASSLWLWLFLLVFALSSVMLNLKHELYEPTLSSIVSYQDPRDKLPTPTEAQKQNTISIQVAQENAQAYLNRWADEEAFEIYKQESLSMDFGKHAFRYRASTSLDLPDAFSQTLIYISAENGQLLGKSHPYIDTGNAITAWLSSLHMARLFGFWYQIVVFFVGLVVVIVTITGVLIWWRKTQRSKSAKI